MFDLTDYSRFHNNELGIFPSLKFSLKARFLI